jgi:hypothetical protein
MIEQRSKPVQNQRALAIVSAIAGLLVCIVVPLLISNAMSAVLKGAVAKIEATGNPMLTPALKLVTFFFPFWGAMNILAGVSLFVLAFAMAKGQGWARAAGVGLLAIPSITGAYLSGPVMFFSKQNMALFVIVMLIGLVPYFTLLLWEKSTLKTKLAQFTLFLLLGVTAAWSFSNGHSSLRLYFARPEPFAFNSGLKAFALGIPTIWTGVVLTMIAIPFLAAGRKQGYWIALIANLAILVGTIPVYATHTSTTEFLVGIVLAVLTLIALLVPGIGGKAYSQH